MGGNLRKILIVDDNESLLASGGGLLKRRLRADIMTATNGEDALKMAEVISFDLILLDLTLKIPGLNGWQVLDEIRKFNSTVKVFILSGLDENELSPEQNNKVATLTSGFLHKPFVYQYIIQKIASVLGEDVSIDPVTPESGNLGGRPEAREIIHDINDVVSMMRICCDGYFHSKEAGYFDGAVEKSDVLAISSLKDTILDPNNKDGIWEDASPTLLQIKQNACLKEDVVHEIAKDDFDEIWVILQRCLNKKSKDEKIEILELALGDIRDYITIAYKVVKKIEKL